MKNSELKNDKLTDQLVDKILFEGVGEYNEAVDVAIVLGSSKAHLYRLPPVVEAYKKGKVKKILTSGCSHFVNGKIENEGERLKENAILMGVDPEDIIVENQAKNTYENMVLSRKLLKSIGMLEEGITIGIATTTFHMRRSLCIAEKVFENDNIKLAMFPGNDNSTRRDNWAKNEKGRERCYSEVRGILWMTSEGMINDWEIETNESKD